MKTKLLPIFLGLLIITMISLSCKTLSGGNKPTEIPGKVPTANNESKSSPVEPTIVEQPTLPPYTDQGTEPTAPAPSEGQTQSSEFPVPDGAKNLINMAGVTNFQVEMTLKDAMVFYQEALTKQGLKENKILNVTSESTFSMVYNGSSNGKSVVVQGVDLGSGMINISIRYEDI